METEVGDLEISHSSRGLLTYRIELSHPGLKKHRVIKGNEASIVRRKADLQVEDWSEKWAVAEQRGQLRERRHSQKQHHEAQKAAAAERTAEAQAELEGTQKILQHTLVIDDTIDWDSLKDVAPFAPPEPQPPQRGGPLPPEPQRADFAPTIAFLDRLISSLRIPDQAVR